MCLPPVWGRLWGKDRDKSWAGFLCSPGMCQDGGLFYMAQSHLITRLPHMGTLAKSHSGTLSDFLLLASPQTLLMG